MILNLFYLTTLPLVVFSGQKPQLLILSLVIGYLLFRIFQKPSPAKLFMIIILILTAFFIFRPRLGLDMGLLNSVNSQRGEHAGYQTDLAAKLIHNKTELIQSFIANIDRLLSPVAIFASGFWHKIDHYYPLGYLFPWDIYFIYRYFKHRQKPFIFKNPAFIFLFLLLMSLSGLLYVDQAMVFSFSIIFFLALLALAGYRSISKNSKIFFITLNILFLLYQSGIISYFKI